MNNGSVEDGLTKRGVPTGRLGVPVREAGNGFAIDIVVSGQVEERAVVARHRDSIGVAEPEGVQSDCVEDRLRICWRAADDAKYLCGRGLLSDRVRQAFLQVADPGTLLLR